MGVYCYFNKRLDGFAINNATVASVDSSRRPRWPAAVCIETARVTAPAMTGPTKRRLRDRSVVLFCVGLFTAAISGCGSEQSAVDAPNDPGAGVTFPLEALNESDLEGATAVVTPLGSNRARIEVDGIVEGSPYGGGPHRIELLQDGCSDPGKRAADLGAVNDEEGGGTVELGLAELVEGDYAVAVRFVKASNATLIACGDLPDTVESSG